MSGDKRISRLSAIASGLPTDSVPVSRDAGATRGSVTLAALAALTAGGWLSPMLSAEVSITNTVTLDSTAFGKWHYVKSGGVAQNYFIYLPAPAGNADKFIGLRVAPASDGGNYYYTIVGASAIVTLIWENILILRCTGTSWEIVYSKYSNNWLDYGAIDITAETTFPTKGTTTRDKVWLRRQGSELWLRYEYLQTAAGVAGAGVYLFGLPFGSIDSAQVNVSSDVIAVSSTVNSILGRLCARSPTVYAVGNISAYDANHLKVNVAYVQSRPYINSSTFSLASAGLSYGGEAHVPITYFKENL